MSTKKLQILGSILSTDETLAQSGVAADAKATGDAIAELNALVGDTSVSTQISDAVSSVTTESIGALDIDDYYGIVRKEGGIVAAESLDGLAIGAVTYIAVSQDGTGDASPENIRPITGWDAVSVSRTGKNLLGFKDYSSSSSGNIYVDTCVNGAFKRVVNTAHTTTFTISKPAMAYIINPNIKAGTYTFTLTHTTGTTFLKPYLEITLKDGAIAKLYSGELTTITQDGTITGVRATSKSFSAGDVIEFVMQLEEGEATEYEPYNGQTITAELPETVYGGTLDWETGLLTITHYKQTFDGTEGWEITATNTAFKLNGCLPVAIVKAANDKVYHISSHYKPAIWRAVTEQTDNTCYTLNGHTIMVKDTAKGTLDNFKSYLAEQAAAGTPFTIIHQMKENAYTTIQLTPQQLEAIDGINYVWSDCGDTCVTFNYTPFLDIVNTKVDKVEGMGLSTNDYTTAEKDKLSGIEDGANKTVVDAELSSTSTNPVQNQVVSAAIDNLHSLVGDTAVSSQISSAIADLVNGAPTTLDTLGEIAAAMEENSDVVAALDSAIGSKANADDLTSHLNDKSNPHGVTLNQLNVTATAAELNYVSGVTGNIQTQLDELSVVITDAEIDAICGA